MKLTGKEITISIKKYDNLLKEFGAKNSTYQFWSLIEAHFRKIETILSLDPSEQNQNELTIYDTQLFWQANLEDDTIRMEIWMLRPRSCCAI